MSHWNHRLVKAKYSDGTEYYSVREVFYNDDGSIFAYTSEPVDVSGESIEDLREYIQWCLDCLDKPMLVDGEVEFVDDVDYNDESQWVNMDEFLDSLEAENED